SIAEIASSSSDFDTLVAALGLTGLDGVLAGDGEFTVFAPTDDAFADLDSNILSRLLDPEFAANPAILTDILTYHVIAGVVHSSSLSGNADVTTLQGDTVSITGSNGGVTINGDTRVLEADVFAFNGLIHGIDNVLTFRGFTCP
ncbi:predicted protein, partial [Phaeodactylum tricornutum CCAP 1055/1]